MERGFYPCRSRSIFSGASKKDFADKILNFSIAGE
jgi:hypothetical protein